MLGGGIEPSLLRTHPQCAERIVRLEALARDMAPCDGLPALGAGPLAPGLRGGGRRPRLLW